MTEYASHDFEDFEPQFELKKDTTWTDIIALSSLLTNGECSTTIASTTCDPVLLARWDIDKTGDTVELFSSQDGNHTRYVLNVLDITNRQNVRYWHISRQELS